LLKIDWKEELKFSKRKVVIFLIAFLATALIAVTVLAILLYLKLTGYPYTYISRSSGKEGENQLATDIIDEIGEFFNKYAIENVDKEEMTKALISAFSSQIDDKYYALFTEEENKEIESRYEGNGSGIGVIITKVENGIRIEKVYRNSPAETAGIKVGDVITEVSGVVLAGLTIDEAKDNIQGEIGTDVTFKVQRGEEELTIVATRNNYEITTIDLEYLTENDKKIAVVAIDAFYYDTDEDFKAAVNEALENGVDGFVFDVRDNGGGSLETVVNMLDFLLPEGPIVHLTYKSSKDTKTSDNKYATDLPFCVLVNGGTASAAELFTSTLKDYERATIIGTKTYGKGCGQQTYKLSSGYYLKMTTFTYDPPYSANYDGVGITPDVEIEKENDLDNQLAKAIEILTK